MLAPSPLAELLAPDDPPPVEAFHPAGARPVLLVCDHASKAVPRALDGLGLAADDLERHIGWDIGAAEVTRRLALLLDAPAVLAGYSRLVIDLNRDPANPTSIPEVSDGVEVPGNHGLDDDKRARRRSAIFEPYHAWIDATLEASLAKGRIPALLSIHSFTPVMNGMARPWHAGVLWDRDPRIPTPLMAALRAEAGLVVGDNEPYSARKPQGFTVRHHAARRGLPHVMVELRQDLVGDVCGVTAWAQRLAAALRPILAEPDLYRIALS